MTISKYEMEHTNNNLTHVNHENIKRIGEELGMDAEQVVNKLLYILLTDSTGLLHDVKDMCNQKIEEKEKEEVPLYLRPKYLQSLDNYKDMVKMVEILEDK